MATIGAHMFEHVGYSSDAIQDFVRRSSPGELLELQRPRSLKRMSETLIRRRGHAAGRPNRTAE